MSMTVAQLADPRSIASKVLAAIVMLGPAAVLGLGAFTGRGGEPLWSWMGTGVSVLTALVLLRFFTGRSLHSPLACVPCLIGAIFLWLARPDTNEPFGKFALGLFVLVPVCLFAGQALIATGAPALRRGRQLAEALQKKTDWPADLHACRLLPEVAALREALREEAAPVLSLLDDPKPQVRVAALAALEHRKSWRIGQPDAVLKLAVADPEPEVRAAAVTALGSVKQRLFLEELAGCLRDTSSPVRKAAAEALLWDCERRWIWVRHAIHDALADPRFLGDGPLTITSGEFGSQAVSDFAAWATESGPLGVRATQTLALHYRQRLAENPDEKLVGQLKDLVVGTRSSAILRIELAHLLQKHNRLTPEVLDRLMDSTNPAPLRLLAVESFLQIGPNEAAVEALRQVARQPNRELALHAAVIVQKYLHVDLGLALGQPAPAIHTRQAAEVTRRIIQWSAETPEENGEAGQPRSDLIPQKAGLQDWD
jgi:hypothetical protein